MAKTEFEFRVEMTCQGCSGQVQRVLDKLSGIDNVRIDLENKKVFVTTSQSDKKNMLEETLKKTGKEVQFIGSRQA